MKAKQLPQDQRIISNDFNAFIEKLYSINMPIVSRFS